MRRQTRVVDDPDDAAAAETAALRILAGATQSSDALERRLRQRGYSRRAALDAVARCRELGYINDDALAAAVVRKHVRAGHGAARAIADLRRRGIASPAASGALDAIDDEQQQQAANEQAQRLYDREVRAGRAGDDRVRARVAAALQRRGFGGGVILRALRAVDTGDAISAD